MSSGQGERVRSGGCKLVKQIPINQDLSAWAARGQSGHSPQTAMHALDVIINQAVVTNINYTTIGI